MPDTVTCSRSSVQQDVESDQAVRVADRLRELIDLVLDSLDEPGTGGAALAQRAQAPARGLGELGARVPSPDDPIEWEAGR
jgi:hypothetical protein